MFVRGQIKGSLRQTEPTHGWQYCSYRDKYGPFSCNFYVTLDLLVWNQAFDHKVYDDVPVHC